VRKLLILIISAIINASIVFAQGQNIPAGTSDFSGEWNTNYGPMRLRQNGYQVEGEYYDNYSGTLWGTVNGNVLDFNWKESAWMRGNGKFIMSSDNNAFNGGWGNKRNPTKNSWTGSRKIVAPAAPTPYVYQTAPQAVTPPATVVIHSDVDTPGYSLKENPDNYAIVVGVEKYNSLPEAQFAERDADAVRNHLIAMGYPQRNIVF